MKIFGGITVNDSGINSSINSMRSEMKMLEIISDNIAHFGRPGYQRKIATKTSFAEYIGSHAVDSITDTAPGRFRQTGNPLDLIIENKGYFQIKGPKTIKLTRDGRFQFDKEGYLLSLGNEKVLGTDGEAIKFKRMPEDLSDIQISTDGTVCLYNKTYNQKEIIGKISVLNEDGSIASDISVKQGFQEDSNVDLTAEFFNLLPIRRTFDANKQAFMIQNENFSKLIQVLGRGQ